MSIPTLAARDSEHTQCWQAQALLWRLLHPQAPLPLQPGTTLTGIPSGREVLGRRQVCVHHTAPLLAARRLRQRDADLKGVGVEGGVEAAAALAPA